MLFFGRRLPEFAEGAPGPVRLLARAAYWIAPHAEFFDMRQRLVHGWGGVEPAVFLAAAGYGIAYALLLLLLARFLFERKSL